MRTPPLQLVPGRVLEFQNGKRRIARVNDDGTAVLVDELTGEEVTVALPKLVQMHLGGLVRDTARLRFSDPDEDKYVPRNRPGAAPEVTADLAQRHQTAARRIAYVNALLAQGQIGPLNSAFGACIGQVAGRIGDTAPPSPWTAYRWLRRYRRSGFNADVLARQELFIRTRQPKVKPEIKAAIAKHVLALLAKNLGATVHSVNDLALALTARDFGYVQFRDHAGQLQVALTFISETERNERDEVARSPSPDAKTFVPEAGT